jgi:hypothetical protein
MGAKSYELPTSEGLVKESNIESKYKESVYNETTGKYEEIEKTSSLGKYKGGNLLGWNIRSKGKAEIILYDNATEAKNNISGPLFFKEKENKINDFSIGKNFSTAIWMKIIEGEVEGILWLDIE